MKGYFSALIAHADLRLGPARPMGAAPAVPRPPPIEEKEVRVVAAETLGMPPAVPAVPGDEADRARNIPARETPATVTPADQHPVGPSRTREMEAAPAQVRVPDRSASAGRKAAGVTVLEPEEKSVSRNASAGGRTVQEIKETVVVAGETKPRAGAGELLSPVAVPGTMELPRYRAVVPPGERRQGAARTKSLPVETAGGREPAEVSGPEAAAATPVAGQLPAIPPLRDEKPSEGTKKPMAKPAESGLQEWRDAPVAPGEEIIKLSIGAIRLTVEAPEETRSPPVMVPPPGPAAVPGRHGEAVPRLDRYYIRVR